jgi:hypothetical protein
LVELVPVAGDCLWVLAVPLPPIRCRLCLLPCAP